MIAFSYVQMINEKQMMAYSYVQMITNESLSITVIVMTGPIQVSKWMSDKDLPDPSSWHQ